MQTTPTAIREARLEMAESYYRAALDGMRRAGLIGQDEQPEAGELVQLALAQFVEGEAAKHPHWPTAKSIRARHA